MCLRRNIVYLIMKSSTVLWLWLVLLCCAAAGTPFADHFRQQNLFSKPGSWISYTLVHPLHTVDGVSEQMTSQLEVGEDGRKLERVTVSVPVRSFDSGNRTRDKDMRKTTEAEMHPFINFTSTRLSEKGGMLEVSGQLTFHGVTREIQFSAQQQWQGDKLIVEGGFPISLEAFEVKRPALFGVKVKDQLDIRFKVIYGP